MDPRLNTRKIDIFMHSYICVLKFLASLYLAFTQKKILIRRCLHTMDITMETKSPIST